MTAVVVFFATILTSLWNYGPLKGNRVVLRVFGLTSALHLFTNPLLYVVLMTGLRREYKRLFCRGGNRVGVFQQQETRRRPERNAQLFSHTLFDGGTNSRTTIVSSRPKAASNEIE